MHDYQQKIDHQARILLPALATCVFFILTLVPISIPGLASFLPDVCLISIYYWTILRPDVMPYWFVFLLGLVKDAMLGNPLGLFSLIFILFRLLVERQRVLLAKETFLATWINFSLLALATLVASWLLMCLYLKTVIPLIDIAMQWILTSAFYPLLHMAFNALYVFLPKETK